MSAMETAARDSGTEARRWWIWLLVSAAVIAADQTSKSWVESALRIGEQRALTANFSIVLAYNTGAAFSFLADASGWQRYLFAGLALAASALMIWLLRRGGDRIYSLALSLILGGALGNLWDRVFYGAVFDFLAVHLGNLPLFVCNFADIAISVGVVLLFLDSLLGKPAGPKPRWI